MEDAKKVTIRGIREAYMGGGIGGGRKGFLLMSGKLGRGDVLLVYQTDQQVTTPLTTRTEHPKGMKI